MGLASCIIARAEATFATPEGQELQKKWGVPEDFEARCFVLLGYCKGGLSRGEAPQAGPKRHRGGLSPARPVTPLQYCKSSQQAPGAFCYASKAR